MGRRSRGGEVREKDVNERKRKTSLMLCPSQHIHPSLVQDQKYHLAWYTFSIYVLRYIKF